MNIDKNKPKTIISTIRISAFYLCLLVIHGCATLDKNECLNANWHDIGYEDGARGYSTQRLGNHRKACAKHNITPDSTRYKSGHTEGVPLYCVATRGFAIASNGKNYPNLCPEQRFPEFKKAFLKGKEVYVLKSEKRILQEEIITLEKEIQLLSELVSENKALIVLPDTAPHQRRTLHRENKDIEFTILDAQEQIYFLEEDINAIEDSIRKISF